MKKQLTFDLQLFAEVMEPVKIKTRLEVKSEVGSNMAELFLYGTIRKAYPWEDGSECISSKGVMNSLIGLSGKDINVHINSGGGDTFEAICICNMLKQHDGVINVYIDALAGSGASVIATAGEKVYMFPNSMQMIHNASANIYGNAKELRKAADDLDKISESACQSYKSKFVGTDEELAKLLDDETFLTATECLTFGLCTEIIEDKKIDPPAEPQTSIKTALFAKYHKEPLTDVAKTSIFNAFKK